MLMIQSRTEILDPEAFDTAISYFSKCNLGNAKWIPVGQSLAECG